MPFHRGRGGSIRPVNRIKHVVDNSATVAAGAVNTVILVLAKDDPVLAQTNQVITGSIVNAIYLRVEVASNEAQDVGAIPNIYMFVWKNPGGNLTAPATNAVGTSDNKKYVIHQEMTMMENNLGGNPRTLFNGVIVIPKGYRRFGPNDTLELKVGSTAVNITNCSQCHYKEFR